MDLEHDAIVIICTIMISMLSYSETSETSETSEILKSSKPFFLYYYICIIIILLYLLESGFPRFHCIVKVNLPVKQPIQLTHILLHQIG